MVDAGNKQVEETKKEISRKEDELQSKTHECELAKNRYTRWSHNYTIMRNLVKSLHMQKRQYIRTKTNDRDVESMSRFWTSKVPISARNGFYKDLANRPIQIVNMLLGHLISIMKDADYLDILFIFQDLELALRAAYLYMQTHVKQDTDNYMIEAIFLD